MYVYALVLSRVWLCDPMDYSTWGSPVHWIFHSRIVEWVAISFSRESSWPRDRTASYVSPASAGWLFTITPKCYAESIKHTYTHTKSIFSMNSFLLILLILEWTKSAQWLPLGRWKQRLNWKECEKCSGIMLIFFMLTYSDLDFTDVNIYQNSVNVQLRTVHYIYNLSLKEKHKHWLWGYAYWSMQGGKCPVFHCLLWNALKVKIN